MKLRIRGDSIRLRLRKPEVYALLETGSVLESTSFGPGSRFHYRIQSGGESIIASFVLAELTVRIPLAQLHRWASTDQVGISAEQATDDGRTLSILVEKDFACREGQNKESQEDAFENPVFSNKC